MIFKRPYAFLIKYFRIINYILAFLFIYIAYKSYKIMEFFNNYVVHNYSGNFYKNFYIEYISPITFISFALIIIGLAIVLWLLIYKKKPIKIYASSIIYYIVLIIYFQIVKNTMITMETSVITAEISRIYRDLSLIFLLPQIFFIISFVLRGFGVNIQKFNFEKDIKELEVSSEDNEEVEITFKNDAVKLKRVFRRYIREFSYYLKENTFIVRIISVFLVIGLIFFIYKLFPEKIDSNYKQGNTFTYNNLTFTLKDSIITNLNYNGEKFNNNKYYLVTVLNVSNSGNEDRILDYNKFRLIIDDKNNIYPVLDSSLNFVDYAKDYTSTIIRGNTEFDYSLVFEIEESEIRNNYKIKFASGNTLKDNVRVGKYNYITITPSLVDKVNLISTSDLGEKVTLINSNLGNTRILINNPEITNKYIYNYESCYEKKCNTYKGIVNLDYTRNDKTLLILDYEYELDESIPFAKTSKTIDGFVNYFIKIKYAIGENEYYDTVKNVTPSNLNNKIVLEVTNKINKADNIYLSVIIRNKEYLIIIK